MTEGVLIGLLTVAAMINVGLLAALVAVWAKKSKPVNANPHLPDPTTIKSGDMAAAFWLHEFNRMHQDNTNHDRKIEDLSTKLGEKIEQMGDKLGEKIEQMGAKFSERMTNIERTVEGLPTKSSRK